MGDENAKKLILARRARFVAAALAGVTTAGSAAVAVDACGGQTDSPNGQQAQDAGNDGATPQPCLSPTANPQPCLTRAIPPDAGGDAGDAGTDADAGTPQPCLSPLPPDGG